MITSLQNLDSLEPINLEEVLEEKYPTIAKYVKKFNKNFRNGLEDGQKTFETEARMLIEGTNRLIDYVESNGIGTLVFLDKSARPCYYLFREMYKDRFPDKPLPKATFINIGTEKDWGHNKKLLATGETIQTINSTLSSFVDASKPICVVDEFAASGQSLLKAKGLIKGAFPNQRVSATYVFDDEPFWAPYDELKLVTDVEDYFLSATEKHESSLRPEVLNTLFTKGSRQIAHSPKYSNLRRGTDEKDLRKFANVFEDLQSAPDLRIELSSLARDTQVPYVSNQNPEKPYLPDHLDINVSEALRE